jgi:hypothetical protein
MWKGTLVNLLDLVTRIRQNHAVEHATIHVLSGRCPQQQLIGRSSLLSGFVIYGDVPTHEVESAAREALSRLQGGEEQLAIHPWCGTNLAVTGVLAGLAAFGMTLGRPRSRWERLPLALLAATVATIVARPLAMTVQERITTTPQVAGLQVGQVSRQAMGDLVAHKVILRQG